MKLTDFLLDLLYPPRCAFCRKILDHGRRSLCGECEKSLPYTQCGSQGQKIPFVDVCISPLYYECTVRDSLLRYKFGGATGYSALYGDFIAKTIDENDISCDIITWVPLSRRRLRRRGYDQARLIAERIAKLKGKECLNLLRKTVHNRPQSGTGDAAKRRANVSGVYETINSSNILEKSILLVDDIVTTGATLSEAARILRMAGASRVYAVTVARKRE